MPTAISPRRANVAPPAEDMSSTNNTANFFLGVNQPTWMNGGQRSQAQQAASYRALMPTRVDQSNYPTTCAQSADTQASLPVLRSQLPVTVGTNHLIALPSPAPSEERLAQPKPGRTGGHFLNGANRDSAQQTSTVSYQGSVPYEMASVPFAGAQSCLQGTTRAPLQDLAGVWRKKIEDYLNMNGGRQKLVAHAGILLPRINLLEDACKTPVDYFYLAIHQISCVAAVDHTQLPASVLAQANLASGLKILHGLLGESQINQQGFQEYFATFPDRMTNLASVPIYQEALSQAVNSLLKIAANYGAVEQFWVTQQTPPMLDRIIDVLGVISPILQRIICNAVVRKTFTASGFRDQLVQQFEDSFREYQREYSVIRMHQHPQFKAALRDKYFLMFKKLYNDFATRHNLLRNQWQPMAADQQSQIQQNITTHFFSRPGVIGPNVHPSDPGKFALHEAYLREPTLKVVDQDATTFPPVPVYRFVEKLALPLRLFKNEVRIQEWSFEIPQLEYDSLAPDVANADGTQTRAISNDTKAYRLRCGKGFEAMPENKWVISDTEWPTDVYWLCNDHRLLPRRKLHNGRDLPIDITRLVKQGENSIRAYSNRPENAAEAACVIAVEVIGAGCLDKITEQCKARILPEVAAKAEVLDMLKGRSREGGNTTDTDDDDVVITNNAITISMLDPFHGGKAWDVPVRGKACQHRDCWDLDTFLQTRLRESDLGLSGIDVWKCPICAGDARPSQLLVDGWLLGIKKTLEEKEQMERVQAIIVDDQGGWTVKQAAGGGRSASAAQRGDDAARRDSSTPRAEIIELDE